MKTIKVFYEDPFLSECEAVVIEKSKKGIVTNQTVAYPEGGGQIGDIGIIIHNNTKIPFYDTQKGIGRMLNIAEFPSVQVDTPVYHCIDKENELNIEVGDKVIIQINIQHRINTTVHHSALHIALMAANKVCPEKVKCIKGCKITTAYGRLDFFTYEKFTKEDIEKINLEAKKIIESLLPIYTYHHNDEYEAWYWKCGDFVCPCGGTHLTNTGEISEINIKRKNVGKSTERMIVEAKNLNEIKYH